MGLRFESNQPTGDTSVNRMDVPCFVGFVARRETPIPVSLRRGFKVAGWVDQRDSHPDADAETVLHVPVPIDTWELFDQLFAWDERPLWTDSSHRGDTLLGAAVRAFFAQGGRRCWVVRVGDPWTLNTPRGDRIRALDAALPVRLSPTDRSTWHGIGVLLALPEVSMVLCPDIVDAVAQAPIPPVLNVPVPRFEERFVECETRDEGEPNPLRFAPEELAMPYCVDDQGLADWRLAVNRAATFVMRHRRDVVLVASVPQIEPSGALGLKFHRDPLGTLIEKGVFTPVENDGLSGRLVQLGWPWIEWAGSTGLPGGFQPPEGILAGLIARGTLARGAFRSVARLSVARSTRTFPELGLAQREGSVAESRQPLIGRVTLFGPGVDEIETLSDVNTSDDERWRQGNVTRLFSVILRALKQIGLSFVFEVSGEQSWFRLRMLVEQVLHRLWVLDGLDGESPEDAFEVTCGRDTMTQSDLDNGRLIARLSVRPTHAIERITVHLSLAESGYVARIDPLPARQGEAA